MRRAFTLIELIIVIATMGIISTIGVEIMKNVYTNYINSVTDNTLQQQSEVTLTQIANRLQYRIPDSVITRTVRNGTFFSISSSDNNSSTVLEWVGVDMDGLLGYWDAALTDASGNAGYYRPAWSGFIDVSSPLANTNLLITPGTDLGELALLYNDLNNTIGVNGAALFFTGVSYGDVNSSFGWAGAITTQNLAAHRVSASGNNFAPAIDNFSAKPVFEFYKLARSAYAIELNANNELWLYYNYRPWNGQNTNNGSRSLLQQNVDTFQFQAVGDIIKLQLCVFNDNLTNEGNYSVCKEKVVF